MHDPDHILVQQTENVQAGRQLRVSSEGQIKQVENTIRAYIKESIRVSKSGAKVEFKKTSEFKFVEEFQKQLDANGELVDAFYALTPGRQRGYLLYFSSAKKSKTREDRIATSITYILRGKGRLMGSGFEE